MWKNIVEGGQATHDNRTHAHCMLDTRSYKYTHSGVILISFPFQQLLQERAPEVRYTYIACLVEVYLGSGYKSSGHGACTISLFFVSERESFIM